MKTSRRGGSEKCQLGCTCGRHVKPAGSDSPNWSGDQITHKAMHTRVMRIRGAARSHHCLFCAERGAVMSARDWAQLPGTTGLTVADYIALCRRCHLRLDYEARWAPEKRAASSARVRQMHRDGKMKHTGPRTPARGESNPQHKLTESDVHAIRVLLDDNVSLVTIGRQFRVTPVTIRAIRDGMTWSWLT